MNSDMGKIIERTLAARGLHVHVINQIKGPTVTLCLIAADDDTRVSSIMAKGIDVDIAAALKVDSVRVIAPTKGNPILVEVPNRKREIVSFNSMLKDLKDNESRIPVAVGITSYGSHEILDLMECRNLLIAGGPESGKTTLLDSIFSSILYTKSPEEVQLLIADPGRVGMSIYRDIPHLIKPICSEKNEVKEAMVFLKEEISRRAELLASKGTRTIEAFNSLESKDGSSLPYIVIAIDEYSVYMDSWFEDTVNYIGLFGQS